MQAYAEGFEILHASDYDARPRRRSPTCGCRARSSARGCSSSPARAFKANGQDLEHLKGWVADSGEGRWTVQEAIDHDVPAPVITLSLLTRFRSRQDDSYGAQGARRAAQRVRRPRGQDRVAADRGDDPAKRRRPRPPVKDPAPVDAPPDQPIPARPAPRPKDAPRTMQGAAPGPRGQARLAGQAGRRTSCARASASSASRTRRSSSCSARPATSPTARSSRPSTTCGGPTCCRTSSCSLADRPPAVRRRDVPGRDPHVARAVQPRPAARRGRLALVRRADPLPAAATSTTRPASTRSPSASTRSTRSTGTRGNRLFYLATQPSQFAEIVAQLGRVGLDHEQPRRRLAADRHREAVRPRPRLGEAAQPRGRQGLPRVAGLPHRPLPGQGDGPQPAGLPLRQRHLRAALEPALRRPRADHRGRVDRHREPRRVLRGDRRLARRPPEPPAPARQPGRDGAAGDVRGRRAARREGQGPAGHRELTPGRGPATTSSAASTARAGSAASRCRATARSRRSTRSRRPRRSSPPGSTIDDWRWSGVPFYLRTGKRLPKRATEIAIQFREVPAPPVPRRGRRARAEPARDPHPAGRGDHAALRGQGARASGSTSGR